ncbi:uncharacterized protein LOC125772206 [Anopheles funestus]|uniref:uncharacterized protein LOC125772206 n=1 Tax=Anopheles funestus TaxID=62324 RepID=UPI0020C68577|nr:uncharacterized protein LOC125772206 [Anopheles funestus]
MGSGPNNTPQPNVSTASLQLEMEYVLARLAVQESGQAALEAEVLRLTEQVAKLVKELNESKRVQTETQRELDLWRQGTKEIQTVEDRPNGIEPGLPKPQQLQESESAVTTERTPRIRRRVPAEGPVVQTTSRRRQRVQQYQKQQQPKVQQQKQQQKVQPQQQQQHRPPQKPKMEHQQQRPQQQQQKQQQKVQPQQQEPCRPPQKPKMEHQQQQKQQFEQCQHSKLCLNVNRVVPTRVATKVPTKSTSKQQ